MNVSLGSGRETTPRSSSLEAARLAALNRVLMSAWEGNVFYARKWRAAGLQPAPLTSAARLAAYPFTTRAELAADQHAAPPLGLNVTRGSAGFIRHLRSSGTTREPLLWADSAESWRRVISGSASLWRLAGAQPRDRVLFLLSFGASSGPWIIYEGACAAGCAVLPLGASDSAGQLHWLGAFKPTVLAGNWAALEALGAAVRAAGRNPADAGVEKWILCGACEPAVRTRLEQQWDAECFERYGLTEAGSVAGECSAHAGLLHLLEDHFIAESIRPGTEHPADEGEEGELVLTTLGRINRPIVRYRTGDSVRLVSSHSCACGRTGPVLLGGVRRLPTGTVP